jgi:hypothetical protein
MDNILSCKDRFYYISFICDKRFINSYYIKRKYNHICNISNYHKIYYSFINLENKKYIVKKIYYNHKMKNRDKIYFYIFYEKNKINNGYVLVGCNKLNNTCELFDARYQKDFYKKKSIYLENNEINFFKYILLFLQKDNIKKIEMRDYQNYFDNKLNLYKNFYDIYTESGYKKSWYKKLGFRGNSSDLYFKF